MTTLRRLYKTVLEYTSIISRIAKPEELDDTVKWLAVLHALQIQAQALIDFIVRLASLLGHPPSTPIEAVEMLRNEGLVTAEEANFIKKVIGFRNIVVHEYQTVRKDIVVQILSEKRYLDLARLTSKLFKVVEDRGLDPVNGYALRR